MFPRFVRRKLVRAQRYGSHFRDLRTLESTVRKGGMGQFDAKVLMAVDRRVGHLHIKEQITVRGDMPYFVAVDVFDIQDAQERVTCFQLEDQKVARSETMNG